MEIISQAILHVYMILTHEQFWYLAIYFFPLVILMELPYYLSILIYAIKRLFFQSDNRQPSLVYYPKVSCIVTCYSEGRAILTTLKSLVNQNYPGNIEILMIIDSATSNHETLKIARSAVRNTNFPLNRTVKVLPKFQRGGLASSNNFGLSWATGDITMKIDGDTSCNVDTILRLVEEMMSTENVVASSATLFARNACDNLLTRMQDIEYKLGIHFARIGLASLGCLNNISGGYGAFNTQFLKKIGGWRNGTAEDLDLTLRILTYKKRYPSLKMTHAAKSIAHTEVPNSWRVLLKQRLRWDGDLYYAYIRRNKKLMRPKYMGWKNFFLTSLSGLMMQLGIPLLFPLYFMFLLLFHGPAITIAMFLLMYVYYCASSFIVFALYVILLSENRKHDLKLLCCIPLFPLYNFILRLWCAFALLSELVFNTHKDSTMAPWWVIKKVD